MTINNVVIRVDASAFIGSGHVMRCLNLADRFKAIGVGICFICRSYPNNMIQLIRDRDYHCLSLEFSNQDEYANQEISDNYAKWLWVSQQQDANDTRAVLAKNQIRPDLLVIDHYGLDIEWEKQLKVNVDKILVIDDIARNHECDYLLDQNYYADAEQRYLDKVPSCCKLFLGTEYFLFSEQMLAQTKNIRKRTVLKKVFVFFGGADPKNYTQQVLQLVPIFPQLEFHVVVGGGNQHYASILEFCTKHKSSFVHYNIDYMPRLINECDLGICAGGVNTWERILLQLPSIVYAIADNQIEICQELDLIHQICYFGTFVDTDQIRILLSDPRNVTLKNILQKLSSNRFHLKNVIGELL